MFSYLAIAVLLFFSLMLGVSQQLAAQLPWAYWLVPVWVGIAISLWIASQLGQKLALHEMRAMKTVIEEAVGQRSFN